MGWLISAASSAVAGHVRDRSPSWWTGKNSLWGRLTGGGSEIEGGYDVSVDTARGDSKPINPLLIVTLAYFIFK